MQPQDDLPQALWADEPAPRPTRMQRILRFLRIPWVATAINMTLVTGAYAANQAHQVFCQPVTWAAIVLIVCFIPVVFWPLLRERWHTLHPILHIVRGVAFCICIYCILFMEAGNFLLPFLVPIGFGIAGMVPHYFAGLLIYQTFRRRSNWVTRGTFLVGIAMSGLLAGYFVWSFRAAVPIVQQLAANPEPYDGPHLHTVEWIIGMHFRYHTREEVVFDGWRPPLHDPAGVIGYWGVGRNDPLQLRLDYRIALYRTVFPDRNVRANCACARDGDGRSYYGTAWFDL